MSSTWHEWLAVDPEIRRASTPSARIYADPDFFAAVGERVFARSWLFAGEADRVRVPGAAAARVLAPGLLDEPVVFVRCNDDTLRCLSNVCTHRGHRVVEAEGVVRELRCRYHGRRFGLDGRFVSMPEFEEAEGFPSPADDLPRIAHGAWGPLLFAALEPRGPFDEWIEPVRSRLGGLALDGLKLDPTRSRDYLVGANWALYCENYLEGFHIPFVHSELAEALDYGAYRTELFDHGSVQVGIGRSGVPALELGWGTEGGRRRSGQARGTAGGPVRRGEASRAAGVGEASADAAAEHPVAALYFFLFPSTMLNFYPWGLSLNVVQPLAVDRTRVSFRAYVGRPELLASGAGAELDRVEREDEEIVEAVQAGVRSRLYERGRYSPTREQAVHHFHRLLAAAL